LVGRAKMWVTMVARWHGSMEVKVEKRSQISRKKKVDCATMLINAWWGGGSKNCRDHPMDRMANGCIVGVLIDLAPA